MVVLWKAKEIRIQKVWVNSRSGFDPGLRFSFFLIETLNKGSKIF